MKDSQQDVIDHAIQRVVALIDARYNHRLDIDALSSEAHFSRYHFLRTFRKKLFETPHRYLVCKRIDRARELLATSDMSVTDVCFEVGFESLGSFSALFVRAVGWSHSGYRARCREPRREPGRFIPACCRTMFGLGES